MPKAEGQRGQQAQQQAEVLAQEDLQARDRLGEQVGERAPLLFAGQALGADGQRHERDDQQHQVDEAGSGAAKTGEPGDAGPGQRHVGKGQRQAHKGERVQQEPAVAQGVAHLFLGQGPDGYEAHQVTPSQSRLR